MNTGVERQVAGQEQSMQSSIAFLFCEHTPDNMLNIADSLIASESGIIAIEKVREGTFGMGTAEEKAELSARMTAFIAPDSGIAQSAGEYFGTDDLFFTYLLDGLKGSGKRIVLLDMGTDDPGYYLFRKDQAALKTYVSKALEKQFDDPQWQEDHNNLFTEFILAGAQSSEYRELVMQTQLEALVRENPGVSISAMLGATHTPVSHALRKSVAISRTFMPMPNGAHVGQFRGEKMHFGETSLAARALRFKLAQFEVSVLDESNQLVVNDEDRRKYGVPAA